MGRDDFAETIACFMRVAWAAAAGRIYLAGGAQAKMSSWFSKPNQSLISKVTKKRVGFNLKIFVFALMKTVHCRAERNPGRIGRLFNCNDMCFFIWREAPKPKCLPGLVSPIKV